MSLTDFELFHYVIVRTRDDVYSHNCGRDDQGVEFGVEVATPRCIVDSLTVQLQWNFHSYLGQLHEVRGLVVHWATYQRFTALANQRGRSLFRRSVPLLWYVSKNS